MEKETILIYLSRYAYIEKRVKELSDFVAIEKNNFSTYSNAICSIFLEVCGEVDSLADELCADLGTSQNERYGIVAKISILTKEYKELKNKCCKTAFSFEVINIVPFYHFTAEESSGWWKAYNNVKHRRTVTTSRASRSSF